MIILLDGSKGAGKSTTAKILCEHLKDSVYLGIDAERRALSEQEGTITERNQRAFQKILEKTELYLKEKRTIIIDCGLIEERIPQIEKLAAADGSSVYKFLLKASYETQLARVRERDKARGKTTDEGRFAEVHSLVHAKSLEGFTVIETDVLSPQEIADTILEKIKSND